jgi:hypothetical protein
MRRKTIKVRAGDGLSLPLPSGQAINSVITMLTPETPVEILYNRFARGRLACGDMVEVTDTPAPAARRRSKEA